MQGNNAWWLHLLHLPAVKLHVQNFKIDLSWMQYIMDIDFISKSVNRIVITDVAEIVLTNNKIYNLQYFESVPSAVFMRANNGLSASLHCGFNQML